jgi:prevent-host-death family protein
MEIVNIHEAKTRLSRLVEQAARGESFIIAKAGRPLVRVVAIDAPTPDKVRRLGFLKVRLSCRMTLIGWVSRRLLNSLKGGDDPIVGHASPALGGGIARQVIHLGSGDD